MSRRKRMVAAEAEKGYSSMDVVCLSGATLRQLQWWDERGIIIPRRISGIHRPDTRLYSWEQIISARLVLDLRRKGLGLGPIRKAVRAMRGMETGYLVVKAAPAATRCDLVLDASAAVRLAASMPCAVFVVSLTDLSTQIQ